MRFLGPMYHRSAHFGPQALLHKKAPSSGLQTGEISSYFLKAWENTLDVWTLPIVCGVYRMQKRVLQKATALTNKLVHSYATG